MIVVVGVNVNGRCWLSRPNLDGGLVVVINVDTLTVGEWWLLTSTLTVGDGC